MVRDRKARQVRKVPQAHKVRLAPLVQTVLTANLARKVLQVRLAATVSTEKTEHLVRHCSTACSSTTATSW